MKQNDADDVKHKELLNMQKPHHDNSQIELETNLEQRLQNEEYNWLISKSYPKDVVQFSKYIGLAFRIISS